MPHDFATMLAAEQWPGEAIHKPRTWGHGEIASLFRINEAADLPGSYRLTFKHRSYQDLGRALGWHYDLSRKAFEPPSVQHLVMLLSQATEGLSHDLQQRFAALDPVVANISAPCMHYLPSHSCYIVAAGERYERWLRTIGFSRSQTTQLWTTTSALAAAPLASVATASALAALKAALPGYRIVSDYKKTEPLWRPWMGFDPQARQFLVNGNPIVLQRFLELDPNGFERATSPGQLRILSPAVAVKLRPIAEPRLKEAMSTKQFLDLDPVDLLDLLGSIVQDEKAAKNKKNAAAARLPKAMQFQRRTRTYRTHRVEASKDPRWSPGAGGFHFTKDAAAAIALRSHADDDAEIAIQQAMVAAVHSEAEARRPHLHVPVSPNPDLVYRDVQLDGISFSASRRFSINADPMGFGKTVQAVGVAEASNANSALIITLASVAPAFAAAFENWTNRGSEVQLFLNPEKTPPRTGITVASYEAVAAHYDALSPTYDLLVIDELHRAKNEHAKRTEVLQHHIVPRVGGIMAMSGTPIPRRPQDIHSILRMGAPEIFPSRSRFTELYGVGELRQDDEQRQQRRKLLGETLYSGLLIRRSKSLLGLPPKSRSTITLNHNDSELQAQLETEGLALRAMSRATTVVERSRIMVRLQQMRMQSALKKIPAAIDWALAMRRQGRRFVIFAHHRAVLDHLEQLGRHLGLDLIMVHGGTGNPRQRQQKIDAFQKGAGDGIVAGLMAAGTGTTMTAASRGLIVELDWNPFEMLQAEDRLHRIGQILDVEIDYLVFARSVDARIAAIADHKLKMADDVLGLDGETIDEALIQDMKLAA